MHVVISPLCDSVSSSIKWDGFVHFLRLSQIIYVLRTDTMYVWIAFLNVIIIVFVVVAVASLAVFPFSSFPTKGIIYVASRVDFTK